MTAAKAFRDLQAGRIDLAIFMRLMEATDNYMPPLGDSRPPSGIKMIRPTLNAIDNGQ